MDKIKRDRTSDLFLAALRLVKENGHYDKAEAIMDYVLPNKDESYRTSSEDIELTNYRFNFDAVAQFGGSEGIYIDCYVSGEYTETPIMKITYGQGGGVITETRRSIGTLKTLKDDLEAMKIMGELCGALIFYAHEYVNKNISRYTPARELEHEQKRKEERRRQEENV